MKHKKVKPDSRSYDERIGMPMRKKFLAGTATVGEKEVVARWLVITYTKDKEGVEIATNFVKSLNGGQKYEMYMLIIRGELELKSGEMEQTHRWLRESLQIRPLWSKGRVAWTVR